MMGRRYIVCRALIILAASISVHATIRQKRVQHLPQLRFSDEEYEDPDIDERDIGPVAVSPEDQTLRKRVNLSYSAPTSVPDKLNPNIKWDMRWAFDDELFGQISAVSIDPEGFIAIFHRGERIWDASTFGRDNKFDISKGRIRRNTILLVNQQSKVLLAWGKNMFFLPHGLTVDSKGNYWITDVAMHQVFKFDAADIKKHYSQLQVQGYRQHSDNFDEDVDVNNLFAHSIIKPSLMLGEAFQPGNDNLRFCKPTAVAVMENGDFFVSDGYCNSRVIKFNEKGERISQWGRTWGFEGKVLYSQPAPLNALLVPHALALAEERDLLFVADRENARVFSTFASNGTFFREYKHAAFGQAVYSIAYANNRLYLVNGNRYSEYSHVRGFILDIDTGKLLAQFAPINDMNSPHDLAVSRDERQIYVVELNIRKIYKFNQDTKYLPASKWSNNATISPSINKTGKVKEAEQPSHKSLAILAIVLALFFIGFCVFLAALLARYQKRGCLLPPHKRRSEWNNDRKNNFKLSSFLESRGRFNFFEGRPNSRDFSKVNTEPETSEDENTESSLEKII